MIFQWESGPAVCRPGLCLNNLGTPAPSPFRAVRGIPACALPAGHAWGIPLKLPPSNKKAMGLLRSMALIGLGIYSMAMRVDAGSSCWAFLGTVMLRTPDSYLHLISSGRRSPT